MVFYNSGGFKKLIINNFRLNINHGENNVVGHDAVMSDMIAEDPDLSLKPLWTEKNVEPAVAAPVVETKQEEVEPVSAPEEKKDEGKSKKKKRR